MDKALEGLEGKTIKSVEQVFTGDRIITITFTDDTSIIIYPVGDDMTYVVAE
jgi:hypothetical protein